MTTVGALSWFDPALFVDGSSIKMVSAELAIRVHDWQWTMWSEFKKLKFLLTRQDARWLGLLAAGVLAMALLEVVGIIAILPFMQMVADPSMVESNPGLKWAYDAFGFETPRSMLIWMGVGIICLIALISLVSIVTNWLIQNAVWALAHRLSMKMLRQYMQLPYSFFLEGNTTTMIKKAISDISSLITGVLLASSQLFASLVMVGLILILLLMVQPVLAMLAIVIYGGLYLVIHLSRHSYLERLGSERLTALKARYISFTEALIGAKTIRVEGAGAMFLKRFEKASLEFSKIQPRFQLSNLIPRYLIELIAFGSIVGVVLYLLISDTALMEAIPLLSLFVFASYKLLPALNKVFVSMGAISHNLPVIDELYTDLKKRANMEPDVRANTRQRLEFKNEITLHKISFQYESSDAPVLQDVSLKIEKGSRVGFVGSTGSGKSTLIDIVVGLLYPQQGSLHVDTTLITPENVAEWRKAIAYVPQDVFLYDDTILRNIAFGVSDELIDLERVIDSARKAHIHHFIENDLPTKYETVVGERGVRLSGGEKQRIGLARAFYRQPDVLLLDEATSALDAITQERVVASLEDAEGSLTVVVVAHRFSSIRLCEKIYFVDGGKIADAGSWDQLINRNDKFRQMVELAS